MKLIYLFILLIAVSVTDIYSSSIDYRGNMSPNYIRLLSRNGATDWADIVNYNPAGTAMMRNGFHLQLGNQAFSKIYTMNFEGKKYKSTIPSLVLPSVYFVYKKDRLALFGAFTVPIGGGKVEYNNGLPMTALPKVLEMKLLAGGYGAMGATSASNDAWVHAYSYSFGFTAGVAYKVTDNLSLAVAGRYTIAFKNYDGEVKTIVHGGAVDGMQHGQTLSLDADERARGFGLIFGLDYKASDRLNIGIRYETSTKLDFEMDVNKGKDFGGMFPDGQKTRRDIPSLLAFGIEYQIIPERLYASFSMVWYHLNEATGPVYKNYDDGFDIGGALEYYIKPKKLSVSVSYQFAPTGGSSDTYNDLDLTLDSHNFGFGCKYLFNEKVSITLAGLYAPYIKGYNKAGTVDYKKDVWVFAAGIEFSLLK